MSVGWQIVGTLSADSGMIPTATGKCVWAVVATMAKSPMGSSSPRIRRGTMIQNVSIASTVIDEQHGDPRREEESDTTRSASVMPIPRLSRPTAS